MGKQGQQPDWDQIAEKFDLWLPHLAPVAETLLKTLGAQAGERILDIACGTGEPALTLARRMGGQIEIIGIDAAPGMVRAATAKAAREGLSGISFRNMPAESLSFENDFFDRVMCRFGLMLFEDPDKALRAACRVLKPGGRFAAAVWSTPETMPTLCWAYEAFRDRIAEEFHPPLAQITSLGNPGALDNLLDQAGFVEYTIESHSFDYDFESFDAYWNVVEASDILKTQYDALPEGDRKQIRDEVGSMARDFIEDGQLRIPHKYLLVSATK